MRRTRFSEFKEKEVINCRDGERLGYVCDLIFDSDTGNILKIVIPGPCKVWGILGRESNICIAQAGGCRCKSLVKIEY